MERVRHHAQLHRPHVGNTGIDDDPEQLIRVLGVNAHDHGTVGQNKEHESDDVSTAGERAKGEFPRAQGSH